MVIRAAIIGCGLAGLYLLFAGDLGAVEIAAAVVCATAGTVLGLALHRVAHRRIAGWPAPRGVLRPLAGLLPETLGVGRQLLGAIFAFEDQRGAYVRQPFDPGRDDDPASAGRRAYAVLGVSLAPGSFVIRGDRTDTMILHALPQKPASGDTRWPA